MREIANEQPYHLPDNASRSCLRFSTDKFTDAVVLPLHGCQQVMHIVEDILHNTTPVHPFCKEDYDNYHQYYNKKFNVTIQNLNQPLLVVKEVLNNLNMLPKKVPRTRGKRTMRLNGRAVPNSRLFVPELCAILPIPASLLYQAQCLPSVIYRLNDLLLSQKLLATVANYSDRYKDLRLFLKYANWSEAEKRCRDKAIRRETNWDHDYIREELGEEEFIITEAEPLPHVALNAFITRATNDSVNLERLEILGDSFLKYATTLYLFCKFPKVDEGKLTSGRGKLVSNAHLYQLAKAKGIAGLAKVEIFSPMSSWLPPGFVPEPLFEGQLKDAGIPFSAWKYVTDKDISAMSSGEIWSIVLNKIQAEGQIREKEVITLQKEDNIRNLATHQVISDKSVSDCIEALIGAYLLHAGPCAALVFMKWLGLKIFPVDGLLLGLPSTAYVNPRRPASEKLLMGLRALEKSIGYKFFEKSFLVQAFTHPSYYKNSVTDCYQRLEFLGDSIIDYLITWHLFKDQRHYSPGELTDLRSALVNNITFARLVVKNNLGHFLKSASPPLFKAITNFYRLIEKEMNYLLLYNEDECLEEECVEVPKALGDIFESLAGAIYLDSGGNLDVVWNIYYPIMRPIIDEYSVNIPKDPVREVYEMFPGVKFSKPDPVRGDEDDEDDTPQKYSVRISIRGKRFIGYGSNGKVAKVNCAKIILRYVKKHPNRLAKLGGIEPGKDAAPPPSLNELFQEGMELNEEYDDE